MEQTDFLQQDAAWKAALKADIEAAGGFKKVGSRIYPKLKPDDAGRQLANACNPNQKQELTYRQVRDIKLEARRASGRSQLHAYESKDLKCDITWQTAEERIDRVTTKIVDGLAAVRGHFDEARELLDELAQARSNSTRGNS